MPRVATMSLAAITLISLLFSVPETSGAQPASPASVLQTQGIMGTWAVACAAGASTNNIFITYYATSKGEARRRTDRGADGALDGAVDGARVLPPNRVRMRLRNDDQNWGRQNGVTAEIVVSVSRQKMQTVDAFSNDGAEIIREGHFVNGGAPAPILERCSR